MKLTGVQRTIIKANAEYFCEQGFEPPEVLQRVENWLGGADDPAIAIKIAGWLESDIKWIAKVRVTASQCYWFVVPALRYITNHISSQLARLAKVLREETK